MATYAIGDIHGCLRPLDALLDQISPGLDDVVIGLGDYVDRGPESPGVLRRLREIGSRTKLMPIMGNHEEMMLIAREALKRPGEMGVPMYHDWLVNGGYETIKAYGGVRGSIRDVPEEDWGFLENLLPYHETPTHIFVHAGLSPDIPLAEQSAEALRWMRLDRPKAHVSEKVMVCGHTVGRDVRNYGHTVCIDTGAFHGGWLTCLVAETGEIVQADEKGKVRRSHLDDYRARGARRK